jgi:hypothetical protein
MNCKDAEYLGGEWIDSYVAARTRSNKRDETVCNSFVGCDVVSCSLLSVYLHFRGTF